MSDAVLSVARTVNKIGANKLNFRMQAYSHLLIGEHYCEQLDPTKKDSLE